MAENSGIEWTTHTFNPWIGCTKVSPACDFCYAEEWNKRYEGGKNWGPKAPRRRTKSWGAPRKWQKEAAATGIRPRVFCASLADIFDNHPSIEQQWRDDLWQLIRETPNLDWLLLTKRPQNIKKMIPDDWGFGYENVWMGCTVENQTEADRRLPHLVSIPAKVRFLSCEPLLGSLNLRKYLLPSPRHKRNCAYVTEMGPAPCTCSAINGDIDWVITGGESGSHFRHADPDWFRSLRDQCAAAGVPFLFKQWEGPSQPVIKAKGRELDGVIHDGYPS